MPLSLPFCLILVTLCSLCAAEALPLQDPLHLPDQHVAQRQSVAIDLPPLPSRDGMAIVLSFRAVIVTRGPGGCNYNLAVQVNDERPGRFTAAGTERLLGRDPALVLVRSGQSFPVFSGSQLMTMFAADPDQGDGMTTDTLGATFHLDISDIARGVDGNQLVFNNLAPGRFDEGFGHLQVTDLVIGMLDRATLPPPPSLAPQRVAPAGGVTAGGLRLLQSTRGGFCLVSAAGHELFVETALGVLTDTPALLAADDTVPLSDGVRLEAAQARPEGDGYFLTADLGGLRLERTLIVRDGLLHWHEQWTNTGDRARGVPLRHRFFFSGRETRFWLGGSADNMGLVSSAPNPTLYMEPQDTAGAGFGVTAEDDWLRLLAGWRGLSNLGELYTVWLALDPGQSIEFDITVTPTGGGGYWEFLNGLRERWGINGPTMPAPLFWGYHRVAADTPAEALQKALGHLGPMILAVSPWQRLQPDARVVTSERYPKLPPDAPRTPGGTPDLDLEAFLTFEHRQPYRESVGQTVALIRENLPEVQVIQMIHPAMEVIYKPLEERWPIAPDAVKNADGATFEDGGYSRSWLSEMTDRGWGVLYYCPHEGGPQMEHILDSMIYGMDENQLDGIYSDEFSWAGTSRGYSRYDYSRSDGYSADLDEDGNIVRRKSDNAMASEYSQLRIVDEVTRRGKFFLANGGNALRSVANLGFQRFIEGGNGPNRWGQGHLSPVPLILGNMGDTTTTRGVFASVRACLQDGSLYSPVGVNLLLEGADNFVSKQYPITIVELGPGWVIGRERIITTVSRQFHWPNAAGAVRLLSYDAEGTLEDADTHMTVAAGEPLELTVPAGGMVIAEMQ